MFDIYVSTTCIFTAYCELITFENYFSYIPLGYEFEVLILIVALPDSLGLFTQNILPGKIKFNHIIQLLNVGLAFLYISQSCHSLGDLIQLNYQKFHASTLKIVISAPYSSAPKEYHVKFCLNLGYSLTRSCLLK